jgi:hypothetical protein
LLVCSFFSGDALAAPTHWYYGGFAQVQMDYGTKGITGYTKPKTELRGSILNKSDVNGGGRSGSSSSSSGGWFGSQNKDSSQEITIIMAKNYIGTRRNRFIIMPRYKREKILWNHNWHVF